MAAICTSECEENPQKLYFVCSQKEPGKCCNYFKFWLPKNEEINFGDIESRLEYSTARTIGISALVRDEEMCSEQVIHLTILFPR